MTMEETKNGFVWTCDRCGAVAPFFPPTGFWSAVDELRARGWQFEKDYDGGWTHWCAKCERKAMENWMDRPVVGMRKVKG